MVTNKPVLAIVCVLSGEFIPIKNLGTDDNEETDLNSSFVELEVTSDEWKMEVQDNPRHTGNFWFGGFNDRREK